MVNKRNLADKYGRSNSPYADSAMMYFEFGWQPIYLKTPDPEMPARGKQAGPSGFHGRSRKTLGVTQLTDWTKRFGKRGIAIVLPEGVIGIDVDAYNGKKGGETFRALLDDLGPLPDTWISTSRSDAVSGIRFYKAELPDGSSWKDHPGDASCGIDIISYAQRYAIVAPTPHVESGALYTWRYGGATVGALADSAPDTGELPELPPEWRDFLLRDSAERGPESKGAFLARNWMMENGDGDMCPVMASAFAEHRASIELDPHSSARDAVYSIYRLTGEGHAGGIAALGQLYKTFMRVSADGGRRTRGGEGTFKDEWNRLFGALPCPDSIPDDLCADERSNPDLIDFGREWLESRRGSGDRDALLSGIITGDQLMAMHFEPLVFIVNGLLPEGLSLIVGAPKSGKSIIVFQLAIEKARGGIFMGVKLDPRPVLYLALEDSLRRLRDRGLKLTGGEKLPDGLSLLNAETKPDTVMPITKEWLYRNPDGLVIIDTLGIATSHVMTRKGENDFQRDYRITTSIKRACAVYPGSAILVVHHSRKMGSDDILERASGTNGITAAADTFLFLDRKRGEQDGMLGVVSREIDDATYAVTLESPGGWSLRGDTLEAAAHYAEIRPDRLDSNALAVLAFIENAGGEVTVREISEAVDVEANNLRAILKRLADRGTVRRVKRGIYVFV